MTDYIRTTDGGIIRWGSREFTLIDDEAREVFAHILATEGDVDKAVDAYTVARKRAQDFGIDILRAYTLAKFEQFKPVPFHSEHGPEMVIPIGKEGNLIPNPNAKHIPPFKKNIIIRTIINGARCWDIATEYAKVQTKAPKWDAPGSDAERLRGAIFRHKQIMAEGDVQFEAIAKRGREILNAINTSLPCQSCDEGCGRCNCE